MTLNGSIPLGIEKIILELKQNESFQILNKELHKGYNYDDLIPVLFKESIPEEFLSNLNFKEREEIMNYSLAEANDEGVWGALKNLFFGSKSK